MNNRNRSAGSTAQRRVNAGSCCRDFGFVLRFQRHVIGFDNRPVADISLSGIVRIDIDNRTAGGKHGGNHTTHRFAVDPGFNQRTDLQVPGRFHLGVTADVGFGGIANIGNRHRSARTGAAARNLTGQIMGIDGIGCLNRQIATGGCFGSGADISRSSGFATDTGRKLTVDVAVKIRKDQIVVQAFII